MRNACLLVLLTVMLSACGDGPDPIEVPGTGWVGGVAYVDRDGDGALTAADAPIAGVLAGLVLESTGDTVARATSRADGTFVLPNVPVGRYRLVGNRDYSEIADDLARSVWDSTTSTRRRSCWTWTPSTPTSWTISEHLGARNVQWRPYDKAFDA